MFFGLSPGEVVLTLIVAAAVLGPKDLPIVATYAGKLTGRAVGYLTYARNRFQQATSNTELSKLQSEVKESIYQMQAIQNELRGGMNILNPGSMAERVLRVRPSATLPGELPTGGFDPMAPDGSWSSVSNSRGAVMGQTLERVPHSPTAGNLRQPPPHQPYSPSPDLLGAGLEPLPYSALSLGRVPDRRAGNGASGSGSGGAGVSGIPTGSDLMAEALEEQAVARQIQAFMRSQQGLAGDGILGPGGVIVRSEKEKS